MKQKVILAFKLIFWIYAVTLVAMSLIPSAGLQEIHLLDQEWRIDYPLHTMAFLALTIIAYLASQNGSWRKRWYLLVLFSLILALGTEFLQLVTGRTFNLWDIASNLIGLSLGFILVILINRFRRKRLLVNKP